MDVLARNAVRVAGEGERALIFVHGFGCDSAMWSGVAPGFEASHRVVLYDLTGSGASDLGAYDRTRHASLAGHAQDLIEILEALELRDAVVVGHSVGANIAILAARMAPERVGRVVLVAPTPSMLDDGDYPGSYAPEDIEEILETLEANFLGWSAQMAPVIMGTEQPAPLQERLEASFCRNDPQIAKHFAHVTFHADVREEARSVSQPTLVLQCTDDPIAPVAVGEWMRDNMPDATLSMIEIGGHCPHVSAPEETSDAIRAYLG